MILVVICESSSSLTPLFNISNARYLSSPVYEYPLNGQWIMMDIDDGYILWTGIWKGKSQLNFNESLTLTPLFSKSPRKFQRSF